MNVLPVGFIIHPNSSHLGASPDSRVYDPSESPPFGLVEVKCSTKNDVSQVAHLKMQDGNASLILAGSGPIGSVWTGMVQHIDNINCRESMA